MKESEDMARESIEREKAAMRCCENGMIGYPHECRKKQEPTVPVSQMCKCPYAKDQSQEWHPIGSLGCKSEPEYPSFFRCVDALCAACGGAVSGCEPVCFMPPFGWIHVWTKGNGHMKCAAANLWEIAPNKEVRTR